MNEGIRNPAVGTNGAISNSLNDFGDCNKITDIETPRNCQSKKSHGFDFLEWTEIESDSILIKRIYIDIAGSLSAGVMLSQIIYWHLPAKNSESRLRINKNGRFWLVKKNSDWWDECRIKPTTARRNLETLRDLKIIDLELHKFQSFPTVHIALNVDNLQILIEKQVRFYQIGENGFYQIGELDFTKLANSLTETTDRNYKSEITRKKHPLLPPIRGNVGSSENSLSTAFGNSSDNLSQRFQKKLDHLIGTGAAG